MALHLIRSAGAAQFRIGSQGTQHMTGHIYFWYHSDETFLCVLHNLLHLLLRIVAPIASTIVYVGIPAQRSIVTPATYLRQFGIPFDLHAPTLVVSKMPMESVHIVQHHHVDILLHEIQREEMARHIQMHSPVAETRSISDLCGR